MNHDQLRQSALAVISNAGTANEYIMANSVLALLDENAALRAKYDALHDAIRETEEYDAIYGRFVRNSKALGDAS